MCKWTQAIIFRIEGGSFDRGGRRRGRRRIIIIIIIIIMILLSEMENLFAQLIVGPAATEQRQIDVALVERQTG